MLLSYNSVFLRRLFFRTFKIIRTMMIRTRIDEITITAINQGFRPGLVIEPLELMCGTNPTLLFSKSYTEMKERRKVSPKMYKPAFAP